jgi:hypothetical protein
MYGWNAEYQIWKGVGKATFLYFPGKTKTKTEHSDCISLLRLSLQNIID